MNTLSAIDDVFADIVSSHVQLKSIQKHSFDEVDMDKVTLEEYPLLYAQVTSSTVDTGLSSLITSLWLLTWLWSDSTTQSKTC